MEIVLSISSFPFPSSKHVNFTSLQHSIVFQEINFSRSIYKPKIIHTSLYASTTLSPLVLNDEIIEGESANENSSESKLFSWRDHWYPVSIIEDLDRNKPTPFQLLGRNLVLWFDKNKKEWVAFDDKCPHRLAPLSEGRINENGELQCSYHGWSFDRCGNCSRIPQAKPNGPAARAIKSKRACATRFPTMVCQGLLYVWPDENSWEKARITVPPKLPDNIFKPEFTTVSYQRDVFYGYETLMENTTDPAHVNFTHHKVAGNRSNAQPLQFTMESSGALGFAGANNDNPRLSTKFIAPCYVVNKGEVEVKLPVFGNQKLVIYYCSLNVPMAPGKTRAIFFTSRNFLRFAMAGSAWWQVIPRWLDHWQTNKIFDGDAMVLRGQEESLISESTEGSEKANSEYTKITFTPTSADRFVIAFRKWLQKHGNNKPDWFGSSNQQLLPSVYLSRRQILDRFEQHTMKCSSCKKAYTEFQRWEKWLTGATVVFGATASLPPDSWFRVLLVALAITSAGSAYALHTLKENFQFVDYVHADMD